MDDTIHDQITFPHLALECYRMTERVLRFHRVAPSLGSRVDFGQCRRAIEELCRSQGRDAKGLESLSAIQNLIECGADTDLTSEAWSEGRRQLDCYHQWLKRTFPEATAPACAHPEVRVNLWCERCGKETATTHLAVITPQGIVKHDLCDACHQELEALNQTPG